MEVLHSYCDTGTWPTPESHSCPGDIKCPSFLCVQWIVLVESLGSGTAVLRSKPQFCYIPTWALKKKNCFVPYFPHL